MPAEVRVRGRVRGRVRVRVRVRGRVRVRVRARVRAKELPHFSAVQLSLPAEVALLATILPRTSDCVTTYHLLLAADYLLTSRTY